MRSLSIFSMMLATSAYAADLPVKSIPAELPSAFYIGAWGGFGISGTTSTLVQGGAIVGEFPTMGETIGTMAGLVAGWAQTSGRVYYGVELSAGYDFRRECYSIDCVGERHPGWLAQENLEVGFRPWTDMIIAGRAGVAHRNNNLCAFDLPALQRDCGSGIVTAPSGGLKVEYLISPNLSAFATWDHVLWRGYSVTTPAYPAVGFQNGLSVTREDLLRVGGIYRF